ncbi:MAG: hypothetical protein KDD40_08395, partial [Bdellovibrionales bacterium]|nr:hypothetical protein [Bdellovibrionales bacterium]
MKLFFTLLFTLTLGLSVTATSIVPNVKYSKVTSMDIKHPNMLIHNVGEVYLEHDLGNSKIKLYVNFVMTCSTENSCTEIGIEPLNEEFDIYLQGATYCGSLFYYGAKENPNNPNEVYSLTIYDNTTDICEESIKSKAVEAVFESYDKQTNESLVS